MIFAASSFRGPPASTAAAVAPEDFGTRCRSGQRPGSITGGRAVASLRTYDRKSHPPPQCGILSGPSRGRPGRRSFGIPTLQGFLPPVPPSPHPEPVLPLVRVLRREPETMGCSRARHAPTVPCSGTPNADCRVLATIRHGEHHVISAGDEARPPAPGGRPRARPPHRRDPRRPSV